MSFSSMGMLIWRRILGLVRLGMKQSVHCFLVWKKLPFSAKLMPHVSISGR